MTDVAPRAGVNTEFRLYDTRDFTASVRAIKLSISKLSQEAFDKGNIPVRFVPIRWMKNSDCLLCPASIQNEDTIGPSSSGHTVAIEHLGRDVSPMYRRIVSEIAIELYPMQMRTHWAKLFDFLPGIEQHLRRVYGPSFERFRQVCDALDPMQTFLNTSLRRLFYPSTRRHY